MRGDDSNIQYSHCAQICEGEARFFLMFWIQIIYAMWFSQPSSDDQGALAQLEEQVRVLEGSVLRPLSGSTEVPPALEYALDTLKELVSSRVLSHFNGAEGLNTSKVKEATDKWERRAKRGRFEQSSTADQEGNRLQGFVDDVKEALQMLRVRGFPSKHTPLISMTNIPSQASADIHQIIQQFVSISYGAYPN